MILNRELSVFTGLIESLLTCCTRKIVTLFSFSLKDEKLFRGVSINVNKFYRATKVLCCDRLVTHAIYSTIGIENTLRSKRNFSSVY